MASDFAWPQHTPEGFGVDGWDGLLHLHAFEKVMGVGLMDTICPPSTQFAAYNKIRSKKRTIIYPDFGHEGLPGFQDEVFQFMAQL